MKIEATRKGESDISLKSDVFKSGEKRDLYNKGFFQEEFIEKRVMFGYMNEANITRMASMSIEEIRRYAGLDLRLKEKPIYCKNFTRQKSEISNVKKRSKDATKPTRSKSDPCLRAIHVMLEEIEKSSRCIVKETYFDLSVFSSTSLMKHMLQRYFKIAVPPAIIRCHASTDLEINQLQFLENMMEHKISSDKETTSIKEIQCIDVNVVVLEPERDRIDKSVLRLSQMDCHLLDELKQQTFIMTDNKPFQDFIFVLQTDGIEYTLNNVSTEISETLKSDHRDIFKLVFGSEDMRIEERIEATLNQRLKTLMEDKVENSQLSKEQTDMMQNEIDKRKYMVQLHQIKTVALRQKLVIGFGCVARELCVYLLQNDESDKSKVEKYLEEFCGKPPDGYKLIIEHKTRNLKPFSKIEQGSEIQGNINTGQEAQQIVAKHGSAGMFLSDGTDTYLTTCAHVIAENEYVYLPTDNFRLGQSVLMFHSGIEVGKRKDPWMDFSLIKMSPERPITCQLGLRTILDTFTNGRIFRGNVCNIDKRMVFKWAATEPYLRRAKCLGVDEYNQMFFLVVDNDKFADKGDSGSIVCVGDDQHMAEAVFVFVGATDGQDVDVSAKRNIYRYHVYKIHDALKKLVQVRKSVITPCLEPYEIQILPKA